MRRYASDTLARPNQSGLGNGTDNQGWSRISGPMTGDIVSNKGHILANPNGDTYFRYGSKVARDVKARVRFRCTNHGNDVFGIALRAIDAGNCYRPRAAFGAV